ncbi:MAG TPA: ABC transporter substrate-binding protein [Verrucomicrobiae bacterium]|jgi:ABC-type nitrate/sulfonate/bicarbonate transport system substrate-binding protein|nr:ABC transporter substrate-binding protein [Verrucomicrobiae bacterium]
MRRKVFTLIAALIFSMFAQVVAAADPILKLGWSGSGVGADLLKLAGRSGVWHKHGLDVRPIYLTSGNLMAQTLSSGEIGLAGFDVTAMLGLGVSGARDLRVVAVMIDRLEPFFVAQKSIATPAELKGKRVTISRFGSGSDIITRVALRYWKLDPDKDVAFLQSGNTPTRIAALVAGHVDAALVSSTQVQKVLETGCCRVLADLSELPIDYANYGVVVSGALLKTQRENVRKFLEALTETIYIFKTKPDAAMAVLRESNSDPQVVRPLYERLAKAMAEYPVPEPKGIQTALDFLSNPKARGVRAEEFMDTSLMEEIKKSGFIEKLYGRN